jgi:hypothetical protein
VPLSMAWYGRNSGGGLPCRGDSERPQGFREEFGVCSATWHCCGPFGGTRRPVGTVVERALDLMNSELGPLACRLRSRHCTVEYVPRPTTIGMIKSDLRVVN